MDEVGIASSFGSSGPWCGRAWRRILESWPSVSVRPHRHTNGVRATTLRAWPSSRTSSVEAERDQVERVRSTLVGPPP
jgi:hypothetical protein